MKNFGPNCPFFMLTPDFGKSDVIWIVGQSVVGVLGWSTNLEANMHLPVA